MIIRGNTVGTTVPRPDYAQTDESKSDFIRNKPDAAIVKAQKTAEAASSLAAGALARSGGTMTGTLDMGGMKLTGLPQPEVAGEAVPMGYLESYVNLKHMDAMVTLTAAGWSEAAPYTQSVAVEGLLASDRPHYGVCYSESWEAEKEAFALVDKLEACNGMAVFTCYEDRPGCDLTIQMEVNR